MTDKPDSTNNKNEKSRQPVSRRDILKSFATVPVLGALAYGYWRKKKHHDLLINNLRNITDLSVESPVVFSSDKKSPVLRIGIIGYGIRGRLLLKAAGFQHPDILDNWKNAAKENSNDKRYEDFLSQEDLNIRITGVCDIFDVYAEQAMEASANHNRVGRKDLDFGKGTAKRFKHYKDLMRSDDVDAVIIAAPDHWHTEMTIEAVRNGKHVYLEKPMTLNVDETIRIRDTVKNSDIVFQLGHQGRQTESYLKAKEAVEMGIIGKINLIEVTTNRNSLNGAWVYNIHKDAGNHNIDWDHFQEPCETKRPFSAERFFRWRCWWDYGTGLSGDLLTHEYDVINQILRLGIPASAVSSGGVYFYKDKNAGHFIEEVREVPDVWQACLEFPDKDMTMLYSASLASNKDRGKAIMGHDGYMELGNNLTIYADRNSTKYQDKINNGIIDPKYPIFTYIPGRNNIDAVSTATERYFASRGLLYTYRDGKRTDTTFLHIKEWIDCIRETIHSGHAVQPGCNMDEGFQEAITAHMATISYHQKRKVFWDKVNEKIV